MLSLLTKNAHRRVLGIALATGVTVPLCATTAQASPTAPELSPFFYLVTDEKVMTPPLALSPTQVSAPVTVPEDATWEIDTPQIVITPNPEPEPEPEPVALPEPETPVRSSAPSRDADRQAPPVEQSASAPAPAPAGSGSVIDIAASLVGIPYVYGGTTTSGFDCSGFTQYVYGQVGVSLPRTSSAQANAGVAVSKADGQPGDLVTMPGHVGIYAGNGMMYDAPRPGKSTQLRKIWTDNYQLRRVL